MEEAIPFGLMTSSMCGIWVFVIVAQVFFGLMVFVLSAAALAGWIWMIVDVIQRDSKTFKSQDERTLWILLVVLAGWIGALIYYIVEYRRYKGLDRKQS